MTTVVNVQTTKIHRNQLTYIGRNALYGSTIYGNPYRISNLCTRQEAIQKYRTYVLTSPTVQRKLEGLRGHTLACHCSPLPCHGDVIVEFLHGTTVHNDVSMGIPVGRTRGRNAEKRKAYKKKITISTKLLQYLFAIPDLKVESGHLVIPSWVQNLRFFGRTIAAQLCSLFPRGVPIGLSGLLFPVVDEEGVCPGTELCLMHGYLIQRCDMGLTSW